jgi:methylglutaconyl-CoA hydratase
MTAFVQSTILNDVATVRLNRPDVHNAFNEQMLRELTEAFAGLAANRAVRAVILASEGKSFCAGADVHWMKRMVDFTFEENVQDAGLLAAMLRGIRECPKPVIGRVHGAALGGGVGLVASCDLAAATASATFALTEVKLGIVPAVISPFVLEKIGMGAMRRYAVTAERFDAAEAKRIGLIHEVASNAEDLDRWIDEQVRLIRANGPEATGVCKGILREVAAVGGDWDQLQSLTTQRIAERRVSPEGQEGLRSFLEKRPPRWVAAG